MIATQSDEHVELERNNSGWRGFQMVVDASGESVSVSCNVTLPDLGVGLSTQGPRHGIKSHYRLTPTQARQVGAALMRIADAIDRGDVDG